MENKSKKVYGMLLEIRDAFFLSIQYASSLEEAISQAKLEFHRINPPSPDSDNSLIGLKVSLFSFKSIDSLLHENKVYDNKQLEKIALKHHQVEKEEDKQKQKEIKKPVEIKKVELSPNEVKNIIMNEIIRKKDKNMFNKHKDLFNDYEIQYITDNLKKKTN